MKNKIAEVFDRGGKKHDVYRVEYRIIQRLKDSKETDSRIRFRAFSREKNYGSVDEWKFVFKKKKSAIIRKGI